ncbi:MAG TPA: hypothetical protein VEQ35_00235 [Beijerinckia sp.]|jgi:hypothetical protein|nr:hypothetical protein [Beijerinckia sp.]
MSISAVGSALNTSQVQQAQVLRAADGDYKTRTAHTAQTKDADGDYKPIASSGSVAASSSSNVLTALTTLKLGG